MEVAKPFLLWKLPYIPQKRIISQLEPVVILDLAFLSNTIKNTVKTLHLSALQFRITIREPDRLFIAVNLMKQDGSKNTEVIFQLGHVPTRKALNGRQNVTMSTMNGRKVEMKRSSKTFTFKSGKDVSENIKILEDLTKHLLDIMKVQDFKFQSNINSFNSSIFQETKKFSKMILHNQDLSSSQAKFLFETLEVNYLNLLYTGIKTESGKPEDFPLNHREIELDSANWLSFSSVLNSKCEMLSIGKGQPDIPRTMGHIQLTDICDFVKTWAEGGLQNLKKFKLELPKKWWKQDFYYSYRNEVYDTFKSLDLRVVKTTQEEVKTVERKDGKKAEVKIFSYFQFTVL